MNTDPPKVSFCITCKGRLHHLKESLPQNIAFNAGFEVEFVILDYCSPDNVGGWIKQCLTSRIETGRVVYYRTEGKPYYLAAHSKNIAHKLARSRIVCNLDADNLTGPGFAAYLDDVLKNKERAFVRSVGVRGASGRLAFLKSEFEQLGGYDEEMNQGWGYEDDNLKQRALAFGFTPIIVDRSSGFLNVIAHPDAERTRFAPVASKMQSRNLHAEISERHIFTGITIANMGRRWGSARVERNFSETIDI